MNLMNLRVNFLSLPLGDAIQNRKIQSKKEEENVCSSWLTVRWSKCSISLVHLSADCKHDDHSNIYLVVLSFFFFFFSHQTFLFCTSLFASFCRYLSFSQGRNWQIGTTFDMIKNQTTVARINTHQLSPTFSILRISQLFIIDDGMFSSRSFIVMLTVRFTMSRWRSREENERV